MAAEWDALLAALGAGAALGLGLYHLRLASKGQSVEAQADAIVREAENSRDQVLKAAELEAKEAHLRQQEEHDEMLRAERDRFAKLESGLRDREGELDGVRRQLDKREQSLREREDGLGRTEKEAAKALSGAKEALSGAHGELERIGRLSQEDAKAELIETIREDAEARAVREVRRIQERARRDAEAEAQLVLASAVQRLAGGFVTESTVTVVELPSDELKGRIIGREGRNIRSIELATGVDVIIDDTPEVVVLSSFDPVRREIARLSMLKLVEDGRIHPARIEEVVEEVRTEIESSLRQYGDEAAVELGVHGLHPELLGLLGALRFRTIEGQNLLEHGRETAHICGLLAAEIGANVEAARRAGLLYGVGRAVNHEAEGGHAEVAAEQCRRYGEKKGLVEAIRAYHRGDKQSVLGALLDAAIRLSRARPGARQEMIGTYIRRHEQLEAVGRSFEGVDNAFVVQAGTEIRVIVDYSKISDDDALVLSGDIAERIEKELTYPGEVRVTVIREARVTEIAR